VYTIYGQYYDQEQREKYLGLKTKLFLNRNLKNSYILAIHVTSEERINRYRQYAISMEEMESV
jgi:hypothetical protein